MAKQNVVTATPAQQNQLLFAQIGAAIGALQHDNPTTVITVAMVVKYMPKVWHGGKNIATPTLHVENLLAAFATPGENLVGFVTA